MSQTHTLIPPNLLDPREESLPVPPSPQQDFGNRLDGVIILVSAEHIYLAKACCASIRQSMGNIPITLLCDGTEVNTKELQKLPNVSRMVVQEVAGADCVELVTGIWAKILVFWVSPYDRFLYLDADTLVWGDVRAYAEFDKYDFIAGYHFTGPCLVQKPEEIDRFICAMDDLKKLEPTLEWQGQEFANAGAFFARSRVFSKEELIKLRLVDSWRAYDNGLHNFLRWRALRDGVPRATGQRLQIFPAEGMYKAEDRFLPRECHRPAIIHWISRKPRLGRRYRAADDYRKLFLKMIGKTKWLEARLFLEDVGAWLGRHKRSLLGQKRRSELPETHHARK